MGQGSEMSREYTFSRGTVFKMPTLQSKQLQCSSHTSQSPHDHKTLPDSADLGLPLPFRNTRECWVHCIWSLLVTWPCHTRACYADMGVTWHVGTSVGCGMYIVRVGTCSYRILHWYVFSRCCASKNMSFLLKATYFIVA